MNDMVHKPFHYNGGAIECIDYIQDNLTDEAYEGYLEGNIKKYLHRWRYKNGVQDLEKARWYLGRLIDKRKEESLSKTPPVAPEFEIVQEHFWPEWRHWTPDDPSLDQI